MSDSSIRGKSYELKIQKIVTKKLHIETKRDSRSGAGLHKQDVRDRYNLLPIFIECKDRETLNVKAAWREADGKSSYGQAPIVVFPDDSEDLCVMRFTDLLNFIKEAADWKETAEDLQQPNDSAILHQAIPVKSIGGGMAVVDTDREIKTVIENKQGAKFDKEGHIVDDYGYCNQKGCKYSRGYRPKKVKK